MKKQLRKVLCLVLVVCMMFSIAVMATGCNKYGKKGEYTYTTGTTALGSNWNPHTWETNADQAMLGYISSPFVDLSVTDSVKGIYTWVYEMADSITDVTADHQDDLTKYGCTEDDADEGYVFEFKLNQKAKWENGVAINADTYIYSMKALLDPAMKNYRANLYVSGESALAGAKGYYWQGSSDNFPAEEILSSYDSSNDANLTFSVTSDGNTYFAKWLCSYVDKYVPDTFETIDNLLENGFGATFGVEDFEALNGKKMSEIKADAELSGIFGDIADWWCEEEDEVLHFFTTPYTYPAVTYDTVGLYKVDDYTIRYVCQDAININYFLTAMTDTWLVYEPLYEAGKDTSGELVTTNYCTSKETSMSYGTYKMESLQDEKQVVFVQNENWYGFEKQEDGTLKSMTNFKVDGEYRQQYKTTKIVIKVMDEAAMKQAFLKGELSDWAPAADEVSTYSMSDYIYKEDETYTMAFFFNCDVEALKTMDASKGNTNSVVLSNYKFRKAMSLAINRADYVAATAGWKPQYALMNNLYYYNVYEDPNSIYRDTDYAKQAVCNLYGVEYGEGKTYATLNDAYASINGYNLTQAKALMKEACDELVAAGLYTAGQDIKIRIGWAKGALQSDDNAQLAKLNTYINAALEGSGFGSITFEAIGNIADRYSDVPKGEYAIGYGAWGGAAFYPFRNMQVYTNTNDYAVNELGCWDPNKTSLTLNIKGEDVTMFWADWGDCLIGTGKFAKADFDTKLYITSQLEEKFLEFYYRIPLAGTTACFLLSQQVKYYTENYNIMYGFGGLRLMDYTQDDYDWTHYIKKNKLSYV